MNFSGDPTLLDEFGEELAIHSISSKRSLLIANSTDAPVVDILSIAIGASMTLLCQAIVAYLEKKKGQRKVIVQIFDKSGEVHRVEVETPRYEEVEKLLKQAHNVFIVDAKIKKIK